MTESGQWSDDQKIEWVGNTAAEEGDPDVMDLVMRAWEGDAHARSEALEFWVLWKGQERYRNWRSNRSE